MFRRNNIGQVKKHEFIFINNIYLELWTDPATSLGTFVVGTHLSQNNNDFDFFEWTVQNFDYQQILATIKIEANDDPNVFDVSDLFLINNSNSSNSILLQPVIPSIIGSNADISFASNVPLGQVDILLSTDGGNSYNYTIESGYNYAGTSGTYNWTISDNAYESNQAQIKVVESANSDVSGVSNWFPIYPDYSAPDNDLCPDAFNVSVISSCTPETFTTADATDSQESPTPSCINYAGRDVWFKLTVPASGEVTVDCNMNNLDIAIEAYSGSCGSLSRIACDYGDSQISLDLTGQTVGDVIYFRYWVTELNNSGNPYYGQFTLCAYDAGGATPTCSDGVQNGSETGVDCGGSCPSCCGNGDCEVDLIVYSSSTSTSVTEVAPGGTIALQTRVRNQGNSDAYGSTLRYFFSVDDSWDASDIEFASSDYIGSLDAYSFSSTEYSSGQIPFGIDGGTYYVIFVADADNDVAESDESNNYYAIPIFVYCSDIVVTNTNDSGSGSLREAIDCANASPGDNRITFNFSSGSPPYIINIGQDGWGDLPSLYDEGTSIDASNYNLGNVILDGLALTDPNYVFEGLSIYAPYCEIYGLTIRNFPDDGIRITNSADYVRIGDIGKGNNIYSNGWGSSYGDGIGCFNNNVIILGNNIGTDHNSTQYTGQRIGIAIWPDADNVTIGGASTGEGNVISSNETGIYIGGSSVTVSNNKIGTDISGTNALPNEYGVSIFNTSNVQIGGVSQGERNLISGNTTIGLNINNSQNASVYNNSIGVNESGNMSIPNGYAGIYVDGSSDIYIGESGYGNIISGNGRGIEMRNNTNVVLKCQ